MRIAIIAIAILFALAAIVVLLGPPQNHGSRPEPVLPRSACMSACSLVIEPDDGIGPFLSLVDNASRSVELVMYELEDAAVEQALARAVARRIAVRVILSAGYRGQPSAANEPAFEWLEGHGVPVRWSSDNFALTHEKSLLVDGRTLFVMSFNLVPRFYPTGRDFGIEDRDARDAAAAAAAFDADWSAGGARDAATPGDSLVWSPGSRDALTALIGSATRSLLVYNEEMADPGIVGSLAAAAERGVTVRIVMTWSPEWKSAFETLTAAGAGVRIVAAHDVPYIHAKMILADGARAFVGSENFSATSLDENRELGIVVANPGITQPLAATFEADWVAAKPFKP
ncbi:MAG TPA: phospholipase D-like domain-containing protein [Candidatus Paceibacterota bacterium]|nr:phospholipase D-like domain-containing protein [Candidatus Paceibacterota bacterium]